MEQAIYNHLLLQIINLAVMDIRLLLHLLLIVKHIVVQFNSVKHVINLNVKENFVIVLVLTYVLEVKNNCHNVIYSHKYLKLNIKY